MEEREEEEEKKKKKKKKKRKKRRPVDNTFASAAERRRERRERDEREKREMNMMASRASRALASKNSVQVRGARVLVSSSHAKQVRGVDDRNKNKGLALDVVSMGAKQGQQLNGKWCRMTGKTANNGYSVSHSHIRTKRLQQVNLHVKRVYWPRGKRWVKIRLSTKGLKTVQKIGIEAAAKKAGIDLWKLPFQLDETEARTQWKKQQQDDGNVGLYGRTLPKDKRKMVNLEKLATSDHPLAAESKALLDKLKPSLSGNPKEDSALLNLRKLSLSDHELAAEAKDVLERSKALGPVLSEKNREKKYSEAYGYK